MRISPIEMGLEGFESFPVDGITDNSTTDFDLFLNLQEHIVLYGASGYKWYRRELADLVKSGVTDFFIKPEDRYKAEMYRKLTLLPLVNKNQAPRERIKSIQDIGAEFTKCIYSGEITRAVVEKAAHLAESLVDCVAEDRTCIQALTGLGDHDYYTYLHSMRVASYTVAIAVEMGLDDPDKLKELALGGVFHDVGKKEIPMELINKTGVLTEDEWQRMRSHPELGFANLEESLLSHVPREIILHHHEKNDGSGYPHGIDKTSLLPEVQIATLADVFDALTSSRSYQQKRTRFEALDFIRHNMLGSKLEKEPFQALISCLVAE